MRSLLPVVFALIASTRAYWLMGAENFITTERMDPIVNPGKISGHVHSVLGGSNFRLNTNTEALRNSQCTSIPIPEDKSNYWFPHLYFQWSNGSFTSLNGGAVIYYLFNDKPGTTTAFPDDFRMLSGDPTLRTYDPNSFAQQAVTFLCLDFNGQSTRHNSLPSGSCPSGIRAQINFPSCWDGKNLDSPDHKSHVAFLSGGPDSGTCSDPKFPVTLPRIFIEVYWGSQDFDSVRSQAMNPTQPFVYSYGDPTGYGYHADFINGWDKGVLQNAVDKCHCNIYGDPACCVDQGIFHMNKGQNCRITKSINEATTGTLPKLPGNNPVQPEGKRATTFPDNNPPQLISPVYVYTGDQPTQTGTVVAGGSPATSPAMPLPPAPSSPQGNQTIPSTSVTPSPPVPSTSQGTKSIPSVTTSNVPSSPTSASTTSFAHTIPATTVKPPPNTFIVPSITIPSIHIPTPSSIPHTLPNGNNNGHNGNTNSPNSGGHLMPADGDDGNNDEHGNPPKSQPVHSCSEEQEEEEVHHHQSGLKKTKRALFFEELDTFSPRELEELVERISSAPGMSPLGTARRSHHRRFTNRLTK